MLERRGETDVSAHATDSADSFATAYGRPRLRVVTARRHGWYTSYGKRAVDLVVAIALLVLLLPLMLLIWLGLSIVLGRHVLLVQRRVGRNGVTFGCLKFRTMHPDRRSMSAPFHGTDRRRTHKSVHDPRHTGLGRLLRRYSLDELPQLWNVVRGQMSLVGPRPEMEVHATDAFRRHCRHTLRPGLTGPFQLSTMRARGDLAAGLRLDEHYVRDLSPGTDLRLMARTVGAVFRGTGG